MTLLSPAREYGDCCSTQQRADEAHAAIQIMAYGDEEKAKPVFLQLIPSLYRHKPQYTSKASRPQEYEWLSGRRCPFDLSELETLVVGAVSAAQILLPLVSEHLMRLEFCLPFDNHTAWTEYGKFAAHGIHILVSYSSRKPSRSSNYSACIAISWFDLSYTPIKLVTGCHSNASDKDHLYQIKNVYLVQYI